MRKIAIFTEGQSELIFVRNYLLRIIDNSKISFECLRLHSETMEQVPHKFSSPNPDYFFLIINVAGDEKVLSAIKERENGLFNKGFCEIL